MRMLPGHWSPPHTSCPSGPSGYQTMLSRPLYRSDTHLLSVVYCIDICIQISLFYTKAHSLLVFNAMICFNFLAMFYALNFFNFTSVIFFNDKSISLITSCAKCILILSC